MHHRIELAETRPGYRVWIRFEDGTAGEVDLSDLVGQGVFASWTDAQEFERMFVDSESGTLAWPGGIDLAPDALYSDIARARVSK
jgi:hypothetical protein